jgi:hypothetical protein
MSGTGLTLRGGLSRPKIYTNMTVSHIDLELPLWIRARLGGPLASGGVTSITVAATSRPRFGEIPGFSLETLNPQPSTLDPQP